MKMTEMQKPFLCFNRRQLETLLPHRGVALNKIDGIFCSDAGNGTVTGVKKVNEHDPELEGHFPGAPTYPGYAQDEFVCLAAAALIPLACQDLTSNPYVVEKSVRYRTTVAPGDTLIAEVKLRNRRGRFFIFSALTRNQRGEVVAEYERIVGALPLPSRRSAEAAWLIRA